jgi:alkylhydroperoxidase/carboxymuconolactone decarboxylase family protein YurZ
VSTVTPRTSSATHLAFYSGWPTAMTAGRIAKQVLEEKKS